MTPQRPSREIPEPPDWTYWVVPGRFLAGCFPGSRHPQEQVENLDRLLDAGVRVFVNLMEPDERNRSGQAFGDYTADARRLGEGRGEQVRCLQLPIRDLNVPTVPEMERILDQIDQSLEYGPVYLHCWGGVGRTGTVVACWLLRQALADSHNVLRVLGQLRKMDRQRGHRQSPQTSVQLRFVENWASRVIHDSARRFPA